MSVNIWLPETKATTAMTIALASSDANAHARRFL
jgi:hypothetical protein